MSINNSVNAGSDNTTIVVQDADGQIATITQNNTNNVNVLLNRGPVGPQGPSGSQGLQGEQGIQGEQGTQGPSGSQGLQGEPGPSGSQGSTGPVGPSGSQGLQGEPGPSGSQGPTGPIGPSGSQGLQGIPGVGYILSSSTSQTLSIGSKTWAVDKPSTESAYTIGSRVKASYSSTQYMEGILTSFSGYNFIVDIDNTIGSGTNLSPWSFSITGERGSQGPSGSQGLTGPSGSQGIQGIPGPSGSQGPTGPIGPSGSQGIQGPSGSQGPKGDPGSLTYFQDLIVTGSIWASGSNGNVIVQNELYAPRHPRMLDFYEIPNGISNRQFITGYSYNFLPNVSSSFQAPASGKVIINFGQIINRWEEISDSNLAEGYSSIVLSQTASLSGTASTLDPGGDIVSRLNPPSGGFFATSYRNYGFAHVDVGTPSKLIKGLTSGSNYTFYYYIANSDGIFSEKQNDKLSVSLLDYIQVTEVQ